MALSRHSKVQRRPTGLCRRELYTIGVVVGPTSTTILPVDTLRVFSGCTVRVFVVHVIHLFPPHDPELGLRENTITSMVFQRYLHLRHSRTLVTVVFLADLPWKVTRQFFLRVSTTRLRPRPGVRLPTLGLQNGQITLTGLARTSRAWRGRHSRCTPPARDRSWR